MDKWTQVVMNILINHVYLYFNYMFFMHKLLLYSSINEYNNFIFDFVNNKLIFVI